MKPGLHQQLQEIKVLWDGISTVPDDLTALGFPGLTKGGLSNAIGGLTEMAALLEELKGYEPSVISEYVVRQQITALRQYVATHIPSNPAPHLPEFLNILDRIQTALRGWIESGNKGGKHVVANLARNLAEGVAIVKTADELYKQLSKNNATVLALADEAKASVTAAKEDLKRIQEVAKESEAASEEISVSRQNALADTKTVKESVVNFATLKTQLETAKVKQEELFKAFADYRIQIDELIGASSQVGMAASFRDMKLGLETSLRLWLFAFIGAVLVLAEVGVLYVAPAISSKDWIEIAIRTPLTFPLIWLGWFFAKQYGYAARLREDYAFKYATAMSFEAHKREAKAIDEELMKKLLDISIQNFADNPLRIFGDKNHASPMHESLDSLLKNAGLIEKMRDAYQKIVKS